jgi:hypothetical protein
MALDLRPLTLGELLDRAFTLYRRHFRLFVSLMVIPSIFTMCFAIGSELLQAMARSKTSSLAAADPATIAAYFIGGGILVLLIFVGYMVAYALTLGATTIAVSEIYAGRDATIRSAYGRMRGLVGRVMWLFVLVGVRLAGLFLAGVVVILFLSAGAGAGIGGPAGAALAGLGTVLGMLAAMVGCALFALRYAVCVPALVLENATAGEAIRRSVALTKGGLGRAAVLAVFATVLAYAAMFLLQGPFLFGVVMAGPGTPTAVAFSLAGAVAGSIGNAVTGPIMIVALAVFYYDVRIRKEGLDLQMMVANLDGQPTAAAPAV